RWQNTRVPHPSFSRSLQKPGWDSTTVSFLHFSAKDQRPTPALMKWRSLEEKGAGPNTRPLREILAERKEKIAKYVPPATREVHERVISDLKAQGFAKKSRAVGDSAPEFSLADHNDKTVSSADLLQRGRLVVCFFRGRWDPFCCGQLEAMNLVLPE